MIGIATNHAKAPPQKTSIATRMPTMYPTPSSAAEMSTDPAKHRAADPSRGLHGAWYRGPRYPAMS